MRVHAHFEEIFRQKTPKCGPSLKALNSYSLFLSIFLRRQYIYEKHSGRTHSITQSSFTS